MPERTSYSPGEPTWIDLASSDLDASHAFYTALFGWEAGEGDPEFGGYGMYTLNGKAVAGFAPLMFPGQPVAWSTYISVADADETATKVRDNGGQVMAEPMDVGDLGRMAFFIDPAGGYIGVWQPREMTGADLVHEPGSLAWVELSSRDLAAAVPFYRSVFGWDVNDDGGYTHFQVGPTSCAGAMDMPEGVPAEVPSFWMPYFGSDDPRAQAERGKELGGSVMVPYMKVSTVEFSVVADPLGAAFGLMKDL